MPAKLTDDGLISTFEKDFEMKIVKWSLVLLTSLFLLGCGKEEIVGTEKVVSQLRSISSFSSINVSGFYNIDVKVGLPQSVTISANSNLLPYIETTVSGKELTIEAKKGYLLRPSGTPTITIVTPSIGKVELHGNNQLALNGVTKGDLDIELFGSTQFVGQGTVDALKVAISGQGIIDASKLIANDVEINTNGSSKVGVYAKNNLKVTISGFATVNYIGDPKITQIINGSGKITKMPEMINK
jgi:hypothetical protein